MAFHPNLRFKRADGWGNLLSDGGSGFWVAKRVIREMLLHCDGIGPDRPICSKIAATLGTLLHAAPRRAGIASVRHATIHSRMLYGLRAER